MGSDIENIYKKRFDGTPLIVRSPARINLIGEHTDYNKGIVLPAAIDKYMVFALARNHSDSIHLHALDLENTFTCNLDSISKTNIVWANYLLGIIARLKQQGFKIDGFNCVFGGDIPVGAGLSSSAALICGLAAGLNELFQLNVELLDLAKMCREAEQEYAGVNCGIMDQFACLFGKKDHAVMLDCRSLEYQYVPFDSCEYKIVLCDTRIKHDLAASQYNSRRNECEQGVKLLKNHYPHISSLRDVSIDMLTGCKHHFPPVIYKRCEFVIKENARVKKAYETLRQNGLKLFSELMYLSHNGLQNQYEVSCPELDFLVEKTMTDSNVLGARMMGGGFGGCTINLVTKKYVPEFIEKMSSGYKQKLHRDLKCYTVTIVDGAEVVNR